MRAVSRFFARELRIVSLLLAILVAVGPIAGCASAGGWPRVVAVRGEAANAPARGEWIAHL